MTVSSSPSRTSQPCDYLLHCCSSFSTSYLILQVLLCLAWFSLLKSFSRSPSALPFLFCCSSSTRRACGPYQHLQRVPKQAVLSHASAAVFTGCISPLPEMPLHTPFHFTCLSSIPDWVFLFIYLIHLFSRSFVHLFLKFSHTFWA